MLSRIGPEARLLLEDGTLFQGTAIGRIGTSGGEICFNTGMTGYQEIYTDPSYYGQVVVNTNSHIGNYGFYNKESESDSPKISSLIVNEFSNTYSRTKADGNLQEYLDSHEIVGIRGVDTRKLVRHIRSAGAMNCVISSEAENFGSLKSKLTDIPPMNGLELSSQVTTQNAYTLGEKSAKYRIAVLDLGVKKSILMNLLSRDCYLKVFPAKTNYLEIKTWGADGLFISNGPGDPASMDYAITAVKEALAEDKPLFGICLGHQILACSCGIDTFKMHHGHRGLNHPVKNLMSGKGEITSQNHGFAVDIDSIEKSRMVEVTHRNLNDRTVEGIKVKGKKAFSVQYHPESSPGPHDSLYLFDDFLQLILNQ